MNAKINLFQRIRFAAASALVLLLLTSSAFAHECGPAQIFLTPGQSQPYFIRADVVESKPSGYSLISVSDSTVASTTHSAPFSSNVAGAFGIRAHKVGTCTIKFKWKYAPNKREGNCSVIVKVVATKAEAKAGREASSLFDHSGFVADPINTFTGDFVVDERPDLSLGGPMRVFFQRTYNSGFDREGFVSQQMGRNWTHNYDLWLYRIGDDVHVAHRGGKVLHFSLNAGAWELDAPTGTPYQLQEDGGAYTLMDPGNHRRYFFDSEGKLTSIQDRNGNTHTMTFTAGVLTQVSDGLGRALTLTYGGLHKVASVSDGTRTIQFQNFFQDIENVQDARNLTTTYNYPNFDGRLGSIRRPRGNTALTRVFTGDRATRETDAAGNEINIAYNGLETTITDPLMDVRKHTHSAAGELLMVADPMNRMTTLGYSAEEQRTSITDRLGGVTAWRIHAPSGRMASYTDAEGNTTQYTYSAQSQHGFTFYNVTEIRFSDGSTIGFTRDASGNPLTFTSQENETWTYTYHSRGQVLTATNPTGGVTTYTYDAAGNVDTIEDHFNNVVSHTYDAFQRPVRVDYPGGAHRAFTYDNNDNLLTVTDENSKTWTYTYDDNNNQVTTTDSLGKSRTYMYDDQDRLIRVDDRETNQTAYTYDERGRVATVVNGATEKATFAYDVNDRPVSVTDNAGKTTMTGRDAEGVVSSVMNSLGRQWTVASDRLGRPIQQTNPRGGNRFFEYDTFGRLLRYRNENGETLAQSYDAAGRTASVTLANGARAEYSRNGMGLITELMDPNGEMWARGYDPAGRMTSETDPLSRFITYAYDGRNRLSTMTSSLGNVVFGYDDAGYLTSRNYSDGASVTYSHDDNGRLLSADGLTLAYDDVGNITACNGFAMTYDAARRLKTVVYGLGKTVTYNYNSRGLISEVIDWVSGMTILGYDDAGNVVSITRPNQLESRFNSRGIWLGGSHQPSVIYLGHRL